MFTKEEQKVGSVQYYCFCNGSSLRTYMCHGTPIPQVDRITHDLIWMSLTSSGSDIRHPDCVLAYERGSPSHPSLFPLRRNSQFPLNTDMSLYEHVRMNPIDRFHNPRLGTIRHLIPCPDGGQDHRLQTPIKLPHCSSALRLAHA